MTKVLTTDNTDLVIDVFAASGYEVWRKELGGNAVVASYLVNRLCDALKERSCDYLLSILQLHPDLEDQRRELASQESQELIDLIAQPAEPLTKHALAAWYLAGTDRFQSERLPTRVGDHGKLLETYAEMDIPTALLEACDLATKRTRDPFPVFLPLLWSAVSECQGDHSETVSIQPARLIRGVPTYALDMHTRRGKAAIKRFVQTCTPVLKLLDGAANRVVHTKVVENAIFHVESALVNRSLVWERSEKLRTLGIQADFLDLGVGREAANEILDVVGQHLDHLDEIRAELFDDPQSDLFGGQIS